jgi:hypothetical protein
MDLRKFFTIKMLYFRPYSQNSSIPIFHSHGTNTFPLKDYGFQIVIEALKRLTMRPFQERISHYRLAHDLYRVES